MSRYTRIDSVTFGQTSLSMPISVRLIRRAAPSPLAGDGEAFVTSIQLDCPVIVAEVRTRDTAEAEGFSLGQQGTLTFTVKPTDSGSGGRTITLTGAILQAIEHIYEQTSVAEAILKFVAEAAEPTTDPFSAGEA